MGKMEIAIIYGIVTLITLAVLIKSLSKKDQLNRCMSAVLLSAFIIDVVYMFVLLSNNHLVMSLATATGFALIDWLLIAIFALCYMLLRSGGGEQTYLVLKFMCVFAAIDNFILLTNPFHQISFSFDFVTVGADTFITLSPNPTYVIHLAFSYFLVLLIIGHSVAKLILSPAVYKMKYIALVFSLSFSVIINLIYMLQGNANIDISIPMYSVSAITMYLLMNEVGRWIMLLYTRRMLIDNLGSAIVLFDDSNKLADFSNEAVKLFDFNGDYLGVMDESVFVDGRLGVDNAEMQDGSTTEIELMVDDDKKYYNFDFICLNDRHGSRIGDLFVFHDITQLKEMYNEMEQTSSHDEVTGFYNKRVYNSMIEDYNAETFYPLSVAVININGLKLINDEYGIEEGDKVTRMCCDIMKSRLRIEDELFYYDSDIVVVMPNQDEFHSAQMLEYIKEMVNVQIKAPVPAGIEFGVTGKKNPSDHVPTLVSEARMSMERKKMLDDDSKKSAVIKNFSAHLDALKFDTEGHRERVSELAVAIARRMHLPDSVVSDVRLTAIVHDIGMITVSDRIMKKEGSLTDEEWEDVKQHTVKGCAMAKVSPELSEISEYIKSHHERWDGKGYPDGLKGETIPLVARIVSIADTYDAMTCSTTYHKECSMEEAVDEIRKAAGTQFDPEIVKVFIEMAQDNIKFESAVKKADKATQSRDAKAVI